MPITHHHKALIIPLFLILTTFTLPITPKSSSQYAAERNSLLSKLNQPYSLVFSNLKAKVQDRLQVLRTYKSFFLAYNQKEIVPKFTSKSSLKASNSPIVTLTSEDNEPDYQQDNSAYEYRELEGDTGRMLAFPNYTTGPCLNNGKYVSTLVQKYTCSGKSATLATYQAKKGVGCTVGQQNKTLCYCSYEYYGNNCQSFNDFNCTFSKLNYAGTCTGTDSFNYMYSLDGIPPCYPVNIGDSVTMLTSLNCTTSNSSLNYEGVKDPNYIVITQPALAGVFTYPVVGNNLTAMPNITQNIAFRNWAAISQPAIVETKLNGNQIAGTAVVSSKFYFLPPISDTALYGRYYYDMWAEHQINVNTSVRITSQYMGGYFEQVGYVEPMKPKKSYTVLILLLCIGGVLLISAIVIVLHFQNKARMRDFGPQEGGYEAVEQVSSPATGLPRESLASPEDPSPIPQTQTRLQRVPESDDSSQI